MSEVNNQQDAIDASVSAAMGGAGAYYSWLSLSLFSIGETYDMTEAMRNAFSPSPSEQTAMRER